MSEMFTPAPAPPTELGRYRVLSGSAGIRVSPLQLGGMSIGEAWTGILGSMDKKTAFELLDAFTAAGGNFVDTANNYQNDESEAWIGEWMKERGNRDQMVIATKFTSNYAGRSLHMSLRDSLQKLQTEWIDILYVHWWDWTTSVEELMDSLDIIVKQGKVLYLGISDTPAYIVAACNTYARAHGKTQFSIYQGRWNVILRDMEREIIPMCRHFNMAIAPWDAIGSGRFQTKAQLEEKKKNNEKIRAMLGPPEQTENEEKISAALEKIANEHGVASPTAVALAYLMAKAPNVFPIVGGRKVQHLKDNIKSLEIKLSTKDIEYLESIVPFDVGFPINFVGEDPHVTGKAGMIVSAVAPMSYVVRSRPIGHE
ncbi:putative aryl-alcohol dehydrogenase AAD14 [Cryoendolithus antarcticus]|uniref:Putative aryl-alcohol dehydrogenase AAD14 n=1 Tax=Cryoendolithus antarcticus TaxID=1507870 RepID=A0A1V8ST46_9PEZI|nr:putative aryl-alcohol dehydrogenase AAD14 [Cryoendolithus antarcticus]